MSFDLAVSGFRPLIFCIAALGAVSCGIVSASAQPGEAAATVSIGEALDLAGTPIDLAAVARRAQALALSRAVASGNPVMPVGPGRVSSRFGMRLHPLLGGLRMHSGVDLAVPAGSPVVSTSAGQVGTAGRWGGYGLAVAVLGQGGFETRYAHLSRLNVVPGQPVKPGQLLGWSGSTGLSTGPHLHYEMYRDGRTVNPLGQSFATVTVARQVDPGQLDQFRAKLAQMRAIRPGPEAVRIALR
ncbi:MAG TPA: M23 family metallopeptidase [Novosphingobium sp.]